MTSTKSKSKQKSKRQYPDRATPTERGRIAARYAAGESMADLVERFGRTPDNIREIARSEGVKIRPVGRPNATK